MFTKKPSFQCRSIDRPALIISYTKKCYHHSMYTMLLLEKRNHYPMCDRNAQALCNKTGKDTSGELISVLYFKL